MMEDVTGQPRKMGISGDSNGWQMSNPHPFTEVTINQEVLDCTGRETFNYGTYTLGDGIAYRTPVPNNTEAEGGGVGTTPGRKIAPGCGNLLMSL
tara:strand:- start:434 stop:718 length:285 start_codon:yes stop_codon:yes gene_type:complete